MTTIKPDLIVLKFNRLLQVRGVFFQSSEVFSLKRLRITPAKEGAVNGGLGYVACPYGGLL